MRLPFHRSDQTICLVTLKICPLFVLDSSTLLASCPQQSLLSLIHSNPSPSPQAPVHGYSTAIAFVQKICSSAGMATPRPIQVPGGGVLTRMFGLGPYDEARKKFEHMYPFGCYPGRDSFFPIETYRRRRPSVLDIRGQLGTDYYMYRRGRYPEGQYGTFPGGMNNYYHGGNIYREGNRHGATYHGENYIGGVGGNYFGGAAGGYQGGVHAGFGGIDQFRRDLYDQEWRNRHFRHRTEQQIRELRDMLEYDYHLTQQDMDELRHGTHERFDLIIRYLRRQDARVRRGEENLRRHRRYRDRAGHWDDLRGGPLDFEPRRPYHHGLPRRHAYGSDGDFDDPDDLEYASSLSSSDSEDDADEQGGSRSYSSRRRDPTPAPLGGVDGRRRRH